jgi:hypothetical protein
MGLFGERKPKLKDFDNPKLDIISQEQFNQRMTELRSEHYRMHLSADYLRNLQNEWSATYINQPHLVRAREAEQRRNQAIQQQRLAKWRKESAEREHAEKYPFAKTIKTK